MCITTSAGIAEFALSVKGILAMEPFNGSFHAVNIATLDDTTDLEDGRANCWNSAPETTSYL